MLSNITTIWPPNPSPEQPQTGTKSLFATMSNPVTESLADLHQGAWWSGIKITASTAGQVQAQAQFRVRLITASGLPAFDAAPDACDWIQTNTQWRTLPWPISAEMAKAMDLRVQVTMLDHPQNTFISLKLSFHELPMMPANGHYMYIDAHGSPIHHWNGMQGVVGSPHRGDTPPWEIPHHIVPLSQNISADWDLGGAFLFHSWNPTLT
jgi:hypothetical protein